MNIVAPLTVVHAVRNVETADAWYASVLGARRVFTKHHPSARGQASRHLVGDITMEPIASDDAASNIHRVCARYGERLYSNAWLVADLPAAAAHLAGLGIRLFRSDGRPLEGSPGEDAFFTHPRDTHGALEFASAGKHRPPEELPAPEPGSRVIRAVRLISLVADLAGATSTYERALGGVVVAAPHHEGQYRSAVIELSSGHRVELRQPWPGDGAGVLQERGEGPYGVRLLVASLDELRRHLEQCRIRTDEHDGVLCATPEDCHGVAFEFVDESALLAEEAGERAG